MRFPFFANFTKLLFSVSFCLAVNFLGLATVAYAENSTGGPQGPFEITAQARDLRVRLDARVETELRLDGAGEVRAPRMRISAGELRIAGNRVRIEGIELQFRAEEWVFRQNALLELRCRAVEARYRPAPVEIPLREVELEALLTVESDGLRVKATAGVETLLRRALEPLFNAANLERAFAFSAQCPANVSQLLSAALRARLVDLPRKDPALFNDWISRVRADATRGWKVAMGEVPSKLLLRDEESKWTLSTRGEAFWLRRMPGADAAQETELSARARELAARFAPRGDHVQVIASRDALSGAVAAALASSGAGKGFSMGTKGDKNGVRDGLRFDVEAPVDAVEFAGFIEELRGKEGQKIRMRLRFATCDGAAAWPRVRPWIAENGGASGFDLEWRALMEITADDDRERVLATRDVGDLKVTMASSAGNADWLFDVAERVPAKTPDNSAGACAVPRLPVELQLTVDWVLNAERLKEGLNDDLRRLFADARVAKVRRRMVGVGGDRRERGGYWAEALVLEWPLGSP